jgi:excisionase family DNA binding protein
MPVSENDLIEGLMTRHAGAAFMGCSVEKLDKMIKSGELEAVRIGRSVRVTRSACLEALNRTSTIANRRGRPRKGAA